MATRKSAKEKKNEEERNGMDMVLEMSKEKRRKERKKKRSIENKKSTRKDIEVPRQGVCTQTHQPSDTPGRVSPSPFPLSSRLSTSCSLLKSGQVRAW